MRVLLNCSTLVKGGALQAAVSFIQSAVQQGDREIQWHYVLSQNVAEELQRFDVMPSLDSITIMEISPARNKESRRALRILEQKISPDVVFTFFGPAYVNFSAPHLCGVADGWVTHGGYWAWRTIRGAKDAIRSLGLILYKGYMYRKADAWVTEALIAKRGLIRRLLIPSKKIAVVPNSCGIHYLQSGETRNFPSKDDKVRILCMSAYYRHKNLELIPAVAKELESISPELQFEFVLTLPPETPGFRKLMAKATALGVRDRLMNVGQVPVSQGPELYRSCHILFLPSVLETSSANYPESMAMGLPIVTVGLEFARTACGLAAVYFEPMNHCAAARAIATLCNSEQTWEQVVKEGKAILQLLPTSTDRYELYKKCLGELYRTQGSVDYSNVPGLTPRG